MSVVYEAIVVEGDRLAVCHYFERLRSPLSLRLFEVAERGFAIICWPAEGRRDFAAEEVNSLTAEFSASFGVALAVHYDDRCDIKVATLFQEGRSKKGFGQVDEVWAPMDEQGDPILDGPRYPGNALPTDVECDCIRQAVDAGLQVAGFSGWLTAASLRELACAEEGWIAQRV